MSEAAGFLEACMRMAIGEAELSLREGGEGYGAAVASGARLISTAHDAKEPDEGPGAHAEMKAILNAASAVGKDVAGCTLVATHEPCPACIGAIVRSGIRSIVYGYGSPEASSPRVDPGRTRCGGPQLRSAGTIDVRGGLLRDECAVLYDGEVRREIRRLRNATDDDLRAFSEELTRRRIAWYRRWGATITGGAGSLDTAYRLLLYKLGIAEADAPIRSRGDHGIVFHSRNPCPTLEACRILRLDTRRVCRLSSESATDALVKHVDPRLRFRRNYERLRPAAAYCEEIIEYET